MLQMLRVKNLALVESVMVEFQPGLNVITGETGAGKSVLLGALGLLLGDRADKSIIRTGEEQCGAEAVFHLADSSAVDEVLARHGLEPCDDGELIIRRIIASSGASKNFVNSAPSTLQVLKEVGERLVDMHGPHDHQSLLSPEFQLGILDAFGRLWESREAYERVYEEYRALEARRRELDRDGQDVAREIEMLAFQVKEVEQAALIEGEDDTVAQEQVKAANAQRIQELAGGVRNALSVWRDAQSVVAHQSAPEPS